MVDTVEQASEDMIAGVSEPLSYTGHTVEYKSKPVYGFFKRVTDIVLSFLGITVLLPFHILVMLVIVVDDWGNPFFVQNRVGKNGKVFKMVKFRTMYKNANEMKISLQEQNECSEVHFKMKNDPRLTRVGRFIRRTSIDELPQLLNVLKGDMSIIGPRPFVECEQEQLPSDRLLVKPGLSCYWQCTDTTKMPIQEQLELDYRYIRERSFITDIKIVFMTVAVVMGMKNR